MSFYLVEILIQAWYKWCIIWYTICTNICHIWRADDTNQVVWHPQLFD